MIKPRVPTNPSIYFGLAAGVVYGFILRLLFSNNHLQDYWTVMTIGFMFLFPFALGILAVYFGETEGPRSWKFRFFMPWVPSLLLLIIAGIIGWEGSICLIMALPVFLMMSSIGGVAAGTYLNAKNSRGRKGPLLIFFLLVPLASSAIENRLPLPQSSRTVETQITINAQPHSVWQNIERVREIKPEEQRTSFFHRIGFPRPVEATLSQEGIGGVRHATFEHGVLFIETINKWEADKELAFSIKADTKSIPPTTLDEHVTVGGPYFDVLQGEYRIEPTPDGKVILHLSSQHRLSTRFNIYAGLWTDYIMRDIQQNILEIIKKRCESAN